MGLKGPEGFLLRNADVGDAVHSTFEERDLVFGGQIAPVRNAFVMVVRHEAEDVFLEVCPRA